MADEDKEMNVTAVPANGACLHCWIASIITVWMKMHQDGEERLRSLDYILHSLGNVAGNYIQAVPGEERIDAIHRVVVSISECCGMHAERVDNNADDQPHDSVH